LFVKWLRTGQTAILYIKTDALLLVVYFLMLLPDCYFNAVVGGVECLDHPESYASGSESAW
jgi:hypothetical protein